VFEILPNLTLNLIKGKHNETLRRELAFTLFLRNIRNGKSIKPMNQAPLHGGINPQDRDELLTTAKYNETEVAEMEAFLKPFCATACTYFVRIFIRGKGLKKSLPEILTACKTGWEETWKLGTPGRLGDSDDTAAPNVGLCNTVAFFKVYQDLGFPKPPKMLC
jgi:hypothetical protein